MRKLVEVEVDVEVEMQGAQNEQATEQPSNQAHQLTS